MRIMALLATAACTVAPTTDPAPDATVNSCAPAGTLTVYAIPPPVALDWSTPNKLLGTVQASRGAAKTLVANGEAAITHSIGHVNIELDCGDLSVALTGQTDNGGADWPAATDGAGLLLRDTPGVMDDMANGDPAETIADTQRRQAYGHVTRISFVVEREMCQRIHDFVHEYVFRLAYLHYDGAFRARRFEGAGCAIFGAGVVDVAGLLRRSLFTPAWARSEMIGSARIADFLGDGHYRYGGNLVALDASGTHWLWPKGQDVPASPSTPVWIDSPTLDAWSGPEDVAFPIAGLAGAMQTQLPFTIYDPELMSEWAERVWTEANANGTATAFGVPWTASTVDHSHAITYDAHCVAPQTLAYDQDNDDLFEDSEAP
jgi:hypothetical protein